MQLTITFSNGEKTRSYRIKFCQPSLAAPNWIMANQMMIQVVETEETGPIPIVAYEYGTENGIPANASQGIIFEEKPIHTTKHVIITIRPVASKEIQVYALSAVYNDGETESLVLFEQTFYHSKSDNGENDSDNASYLTAAIEQVEAMGKWWLDINELF